MKKILVFAGTTEGRLLIEALCKYNVQLYACVATDYGKELLPQNQQITISAQRMDCTQMIEYLSAHHFDCVIDATHPYAVEVTANVLAACAKTSTPYLRLLRQSSENHNCVFVNSTSQAISYLNQTTGHVLLTTGSKELAAYTSVANYKERLFIRVLPMASIVEQCTALGFQGKHLLCMQGPFSIDLNVALLNQIQATYLVTKDSGSNGGFSEKLEAAQKVGATTIVIGRPTDETGYSLQELLAKVQQEFKLQKKEAHVVPYFPIFCNIKNKHILVVGGGTIAQRRIQTLLPFCSNIHVVSPTITPQLEQYRKKGQIIYHDRIYMQGDCNGYDMVLAATNDKTVNEAVIGACKQQHIPVNAPHCKESCDFYFPAIIQEENVVIGVTASGINHKQARQTAENIRSLKGQIIEKGGTYHV